jgi:hypothetical protein
MQHFNKWLEYETNCIDASAEFVNKQMESAREISKKGKYAKLLVNQMQWTKFDVMEDYATRVYKNKEYVIFQHSAIEYFYKIIE